MTDRAAARTLLGSAAVLSVRLKHVEKWTEMRNAVAAKYAVDASGDIRAQVIAKAFPKANMDGKDEAYMAARFDSAIELLDSMHNDGTPAQLQQIQKPKEDGLKPESVEARMANAYKTSK